METRRFTLADRLFGEIDKAIKVLTTEARSQRPLPADPQGTPLAQGERRESARLLRVNHAGEVAAQALYQGQGFVARSAEVSAALQHAATEETDHLAWCAERLAELGARPSVLNPLWYAGSFAIGAAAGLLGDAASLGFVAETERQVEAHLRDHLTRLPPADERSRTILLQMTHDEIEHGERASALGASALPTMVRGAMRALSLLMRRGSYWI